MSDKEEPTIATPKKEENEVVFVPTVVSEDEGETAPTYLPPAPPSPPAVTYPKDVIPPYADTEAKRRDRLNEITAAMNGLHSTWTASDGGVVDWNLTEEGKNYVENPLHLGDFDKAETDAQIAEWKRMVNHLEELDRPGVSPEFKELWYMHDWSSYGEFRTD